ncbi:PqqD family peptide modification chaperone [Desulfobulbus alkaliphilus]|uniref:PqqD family peptide modification chaperone n=1 Tax=Desulfobulbus alkaliphilus TaxID=869814 RepID=UPI00196313FC|nr:PqqD family peptide modification chaperone [Desulfobulbus alkaliphilus]MBM9535999.1 PqqD family peptide modification chaperone [Desulfobulbus alkaliphilus]
MASTSNRTNTAEISSDQGYRFTVLGDDFILNPATGQAFPVSGPCGVQPSELADLGFLRVPDLETTDQDFAPTQLGSVLFNLTHDCNLACVYCIMGLSGLREHYILGNKAMDEATGKQAIDLLASRNFEHVSLTFFGGEPLLEFALLRALVEYAEDRHPARFSFQLITNATLLRPSMFSFFKRHNFSFLISLDGDKKSHDQLRCFKNNAESVFDQAFTNYLALREALPQAEIGINVTFFRQNLDLAETVRFFRSRNVSKIRMDRGLVPTDGQYAVTLKHADKLRSELVTLARDYHDFLMAGDIFVLNPFVNYMRVLAKRLPRYRACNSGIDYITIASNGDVYPCYKLLGVQRCRMGDVATGYDDGYAREMWEHNVLTRSECSGCFARTICAGGCVADNYHINADFYAPARENCFIFRQAIRLSIWLFFSLECKAPHVLKKLFGWEYLLGDEKPKSGPISVEETQGGYCLRPGNGGVYFINSTARLLFDLCDGSTSVESMSAILSERWGISHRLARMDVTEQLMRLHKAGCVDLNSPSPACRKSEECR